MELQVQYLPITKLLPYVNNSRKHSDAQVAQIAASIKEFGWTNPILVDGDNGIIAGHGRLMAARKLSYDQVPVIELSHLTDTQKKALVIADNKLALNAEWDDDILKLELEDLKDLDFDLDLLGFSDDELDDLFNDEATPGTIKGSLADRFLVPPFTVLNAREGWWQDRKRFWLSYGIKSEEGRDIAPTSVSKNVPDYMAGRGNNEGGSIFDPVLCEIAYKWFSPKNGTILDPFAGGSVRGIVASKLDYQYVGHELRGEQVIANRAQADTICADDQYPPVWVEGDSLNITKTCHDVKADLIFSCPPYADLEVYSDNPGDISNMDYPDFKAAYFEIIKRSCTLLKDNAFACFVVGEVRDKKGNYYNFVGDTVEAFKAAGLNFYNEAILVTAVGSLPVRAAKAFTASRKLGKTHQNVLVFVKGDGKKAADNCGPFEVDESCLQED